MYNIIIPTYNEKDNIKILIGLIREYTEDYKLIIVDDGSTDGTREYLLNLRNRADIKLVFRPNKMGLGTAYKAGLEHCTHPFTIIMDGDLSHDPVYIRDMIDIQRKSGCDIVASTRYNRGGIYGWSFYRKLLSRGANNFAKLLLNLGTSDLTGSYRLYKTDTLRSILDQSNSKGYAIQMEIICIAEKRNLKIEECPIVFYERICGESKLCKGEIYNFIKSVGILVKSY